MPTIRSGPPNLAEFDNPDLVRASLRVSTTSVGWTLLASTAAVTIGFTGGSAVLIALGSIGFVDAAGSVALGYHFLHGLRHERLSERREQFAHRAVALGLLVVGLASVAGATYRLIVNPDTDASLASALVAAVSMLALAALAARKLALGVRIRSRGLIGDGHLSAIGAIQAGAALGGVAIARWLGVSWADACAALAVGLLAVLVGGLTWKSSVAR